MLRTVAVFIVVLCCGTGLAGCNWDWKGGSTNSRTQALSQAVAAHQSASGDAATERSGPSVTSDLQETAPIISGHPRKTVMVDETFEFAPSARDPGGQHLRFSIVNRPRWTQFDPATGRLAGTPGDADTGTYDRIRISVSNGVGEAALPEFSLRVSDTGKGSATVDWDPPLDNVDGSVLTDLAGFRVYYGRLPDHLANRVVIANPGVTSAVIDNLSPETWYFAVAAYTRGGIEGELSEVLAYSVP
jgi:hypothetical protein